MDVAKDGVVGPRTHFATELFGARNDKDALADLAMREFNRRMELEAELSRQKSAPSGMTREALAEVLWQRDVARGKVPERRGPVNSRGVFRWEPVPFAELTEPTRFHEDADAILAAFPAVRQEPAAVRPPDRVTLIETLQRWVNDATATEQADAVLALAHRPEDREVNDVVEVAARAAALAVPVLGDFQGQRNDTWESESEEYRQGWRDIARAALHASAGGV